MMSTAMLIVPGVKNVKISVQGLKISGRNTEKGLLTSSNTFPPLSNLVPAITESPFQLLS